MRGDNSIKYVILAVFGLWLLAVALCDQVEAAGEYTLNPWWQCNFNTLTGCASVTQASIAVMKKIGYFEGGNPDVTQCDYLDSVKAVLPTMKWTIYWSAVDAPAKGSADAVWMEAYLDTLGTYGPFAEESCYYHYWNNHGSIIGWKNLDDSAKYHSRVPLIIDAGRFFRRSTSVVGRLINMRYIVEKQMKVFKTASNDYADGSFIDNGGYTSMDSWFELNAGDTLAETYNGNKITNKTDLAYNEWYNGRHIFYRDLFDTLYKDGDLWSPDTVDLIIELNVGQHWMADYYKDSITNRTDNELLHSVFAISDNGSGRPWHVAKKHDSIETQAYPIVYEWETDENGAGFYMPLVGDTVPPSARFAGLPAQFKKDQVNLDNLAFFWATRRQHTAFRTRFTGTNPAIGGWDTLARHPLFDTLNRFNFPVDTIHFVREGLDSLGDSAKVWCRTWTNNQGGVDTLIVCVRCRHLWNQTAGQNTAFKFDLPGTAYKPIDMHGNLGTPADSFWLRNGQGAPFIRYGSGGSPEPICSLSTTSLDFGAVVVGQTKDLSYSIKNIGGGTLTGTVSEACTDFSITAGSGAFSLTAGQSVTVTVRFAPTIVQAYSCTVLTGQALCGNVIATGAGVNVPASNRGKGIMKKGGP